MSEEKAYLGDGVYVATERGMLVLETASTVDSNQRQRIYLEPEVYEALVNYVAQRLAGLNAPERR